MMPNSKETDTRDCTDGQSKHHESNTHTHTHTGGFSTKQSHAHSITKVIICMIHDARVRAYTLDTT